MQVTAVLIAAGNKLLLKIHALVSLFPVLYLPSIPGLPLLLLFVFISLSFILPKTPLACHFFSHISCKTHFYYEFEKQHKFEKFEKEGFNSNPTICCISGYTSSFNFISYQILFLNGM
ncbi:hypothetical protein E1A91_D06G116700v1 [Gossypium mustelinum]|uniref:Uncharacterized protein n=1 Tax=Gossypium mustelinum TaxID=34275 RepID=A0A5D2UJR8_GOSMU|nr:hypothetical protein E1A91_D06G116700v1 [Gossypium mustelinum]